MLLDQAGWHGGEVLKVPHNISLMPLPPRAPELNDQENIWQFMRQNWLSNRVFILRRYRRSLLLRLGHVHRSALEDHVRRAPRLGDRVVQSFSQCAGRPAMSSRCKSDVMTE